jgi:hypothetical protein
MLYSSNVSTDVFKNEHLFLFWTTLMHILVDSFFEIGSPIINDFETMKNTYFTKEKGCYILHSQKSFLHA